jgi:hypothetical protein
LHRGARFPRQAEIELDQVGTRTTWARQSRPGIAPARRTPAVEASGYGRGRPSLTIEFGPSPSPPEIAVETALPDGPFGEDPADWIICATALSNELPLATKEASAVLRSAPDGVVSGPAPEPRGEEAGPEGFRASLWIA